MDEGHKDECDKPRRSRDSKHQRIGFTRGRAAEQRATNERARSHCERVEKVEARHHAGALVGGNRFEEQQERGQFPCALRDSAHRLNRIHPRL